MSWYGWLSLAVSLAGCAWGWRWLFRDIWRTNGPSGDALVGAVFLATVLCWVWPLLAIKETGERLGVTDWSDVWTTAGNRIAGQSRDDKLRARERAVFEREEHIARLEAELHIGEELPSVASWEPASGTRTIFDAFRDRLRSFPTSKPR